MHRTIKTYVLRAGRISNRQQEGLTQWLPAYVLNCSETPWCFSEIFGKPHQVIVEIGFGMGQSLCQMAQENPYNAYIGIEVHKAGVGSLAADLHEHEINNVRIVSDDAVHIFQTQIIDNSLDGVQIFFPDPWHKKRHQKRRLIQAPFVQLLAKKLKPGGFIHCATDWEDYAKQMLEVLSATENLRNTASDYSPKPSTRPATKFEQRGERLGHQVWDLIFKK